MRECGEKLILAAISVQQGCFPVNRFSNVQGYADISRILPRGGKPGHRIGLDPPPFAFAIPDPDTVLEVRTIRNRLAELSKIGWGVLRMENRTPLATHQFVDTHIHQLSRPLVHINHITVRVHLPDQCRRSFSKRTKP